MCEALIGFGGVLLGWVLGLFSGELSSLVIQKWRGPKLQAEFDTEEDCITLTPESIPAIYERDAPSQRVVFFARIRVTNQMPRTAHGCRAWLVNVERLKENSFVRTEYAESIPLVWSYSAETETVDLPRGVTRHVDVVRIADDSDGFEPQLRSPSGGVFIPLRFHRVFAEAGTLRFTVHITSDDAPVERCQVIVECNGWPPKGK